MEAGVLMRTRSCPTQHTLGSPRGLGPAADAGICFLRRSRSSSCLSPRSLHIEARDVSSSLRRSSSEASLIGSDGRIVSRPVPERIAEEEVLEEEVVMEEAAAAKRRVLLGLGIWTGMGTGTDAETETLPKELEFSGGGMGKERNISGSGRGGDDGGGDHSGMRAYYQDMLKADPGNPLLLRNYGQFLHEVEGNMERAEEYYERAILASPGDGEVLSLYGKLIWETRRDEERAGDYFERAVEAAPDDCTVLGSYAHFLWDAEDDEESSSSSHRSQPQPRVEAF